MQLISNLRRVLYKYFALRKVGSFIAPVHISRLTVLTKKTTLGKNVSFNGFKVFGVGSLTIGNNFHSGQDCMVFTSNHNYDHGEAIPYDHSSIVKDVFIEDNVWLGARVLILGGVTVGEGAIIQAGAVVIKNVPKYSIVGGNPAKVIKQRDIEHYLRLKNEKKFN